MTKTDNPIAVIPKECFRWRARVQFKESFPTRLEAVSYALQHDCNLIVECDVFGEQQFDVLHDPDGTCTSGLTLEPVETENFLVEPEPAGWTRLMLLTLASLARRFASAVSSLFLHEIAPRFRRAARQCWWSDSALACRRAWRRHSRRTVTDVAKRFAAASGVYCRKTVPQLRCVARQWWWSKSALAFRNACDRHSHGTAGDLGKRLAAVGSMRLHETTLRLRHAASRIPWADIQAALRHASGRSLAATFSFSKHLAAAVVGLYSREIAPRLRRSISRCRWAEIEAVLRRRVPATVAIRQPNSSQLR